MLENKTDWERYPGEQARAYRYAWDYFVLGPQRSIEKVIQMTTTNLQPLQKPPSLGTLKNLSSKWQWPKRAEAYDRWSESKNLEAAELLAAEDAKKRAQRQRENDESDHEIGLLVRDQVKTMAKAPLFDQKLVSERYSDGREKITNFFKGARWGKGDIPGLWRAAKTLGPPSRNESATSTDAKLNDVLSLVDLESACKGDR